MITTKQFRPIVCLTRCAGINVSSRFPHFTLFLKLYASILFIFVTISAGVTVVYCDQLRRIVTWSAYEVLRCRITIVITYLYYVLILVASLLRADDFATVFIGLSRTDRFLSRHGFRVKLKPDYHVCIRFIAVLGVGFAVTFSHSHMTLPRAAEWFLITSTSFAVCASHCQYHSLMKMVTDHFDFITTKLEDTFVHLPYEGGISKVIALVEAHDSVLRTATLLDRGYSFQLLVTSTSVLLLLISTVYLLTTNFKRLYVSEWYMCLYRLLEIYSLASVCTRVLYKEETYQHNLYSHLIEDRNGYIVRDSRLKILRLHRLTLYFSAGGFFKVDYSLLPTICGTVFTFVIILMQLD